MMEDVTGKLGEELKGILEEEIILIETAPEKTLEVTIDSLKILTEKGLHGIIVTSSRPYPKLIKMCREKNINTEHLFFIDTMMKSVGLSQGNESNNKTVTFVSSTSALTEISIAIDNACVRLEETGFLFIDSLSTLLIH
ncbi:MAG: hypothetical protein KAU03_03660, partial [Candidatus Altiarchaeales archaeon]|nr:hypothetical protein [Candidatus Altiarchaeales archaeon]